MGRDRTAERLQLLAEKLDEQDEILRRARAALEDPAPDLHEVARQQHLLRSRATSASTLADRLAAGSLASRGGGSSLRASAARPVRETLLDGMEEFSVPVQANVISEYCSLRYGVDVPTRQFASLRRDEEKAFRRNPTARPSWIIPALHVRYLTAMPREMTVSSWPLPRRLIGSRTLRVNLLHVLLVLTRRHAEAEESPAQPYEGAYLRMAQRYGVSLGKPVALSGLMTAGQITDLALEELARIEPVDVAEREEAAGKLAQKPPLVQAFGLPRVIDGGMERRSG